MKNKTIIATLILLIVALIGASICFLNVGKNKFIKSNTNLTTSSNENIEQDVKTIEEENISGPISSLSAFEEYKKANEEEKKNYEIKEVKYIRDDKKTTIKGLLKNNGGKEKIIIKAEFYDLNNNILGSSSIYKTIKANSYDYFEIKALNNVTSDNYKVFVEYVGV